MYHLNPGLLLGNIKLESWPCVELITYHPEFDDVTRLRRWNKFQGLGMPSLQQLAAQRVVGSGQQKLLSFLSFASFEGDVK